MYSVLFHSNLFFMDYLWLWDFLVDLPANNQNFIMDPSIKTFLEAGKAHVQVQERFFTVAILKCRIKNLSCCAVMLPWYWLQSSSRLLFLVLSVWCFLICFILKFSRIGENCWSEINCNPVIWSRYVSARCSSPVLISLDLPKAFAHLGHLHKWTQEAARLGFHNCSTKTHMPAAPKHSHLKPPSVIRGGVLSN